jgi:hypothetical protein
MVESASPGLSWTEDDHARYGDETAPGWIREHEEHREHATCAGSS